MQVIQQNLAQRDQNQGPSIVVYAPNGAMALAQLSYRNDQLSDAVYFYSECKLLADAGLLCAKR